MKKMNILFLFLLASCIVNAQDLAWLNTVGGPSFDVASKIVTDASNNIYVLGSFSETVDFNPGPGEFNLTASAFEDIYVQKLDPQGNFLWAVAFGSAEYETPTDLIAHENGKVYIIGTHRAPIDLNPGPDEFIVTPQGENDFYIIVLNNDGSFNNAKTWGGNGHDYAFGMSEKSTGDILVTGIFNDTVDFNPDAPVTNLEAVNGNAYILTLSPLLEFIDVFTFGIPDFTTTYNVMADTNQNLIVTGTFEGTIDFDPTAGIETLTSTGDYNIFVAKYSNLQELVWVKGFGNGDISSLRLRNSTLDSNDHILITGAFSETLDLDPDAGIYEITSNGFDDIFILKLNTNGEFVWGHGIGGNDNAPDDGFSVTTNTQNDVLVSGKFASTVDFNPGTEVYNLSSNGYKDIFLLSLTSNGDFKNAYGMGGPDLDAGVAVTVDSNDAVILGGTFRETADMYPGAGVFNKTSNGESDAFLMKLNNLILGTENLLIQNSEIIAYPNPTTGDFSIVLQDSFDSVAVQITNMLGQVVLSSTFQQQKNIQLSLPETSGIYFCAITSEGTFTTIKLIKK